MSALGISQKEVLRSSELFDVAWYKANNCNAPDFSCDPFEHYLEFSNVEKINPSPDFDTKYYLQNHRVPQGMNALVHYELYGADLGFRPLPLERTLPKSPVVTIGIPVYNGEKEILRTLKSIQRQTYANWRLLIVDDGSDDDTLALIRSYATEDNRINVIAGGRYGASVQRNRILRGFEGDWLIWLDSGDTLLPLCLENRLDYILNIGKLSASLPYALHGPFHKWIPGEGAQKYPVYAADDWLLYVLSFTGMVGFHADCDTATIKGVLALLVDLMSDKPVEQVLKTDLDEIFDRLALDEHLSPNRHFGIYAIVELMKHQVSSLNHLDNQSQILTPGKA